MSDVRDREAYHVENATLAPVNAPTTSASRRFRPTRQATTVATRNAIPPLGSELGIADSRGRTT